MDPLVDFIYMYIIVEKSPNFSSHMTWVWTFFNNYSNHPRMCVLSTLCGNVDKHSPFDIYIYHYGDYIMGAIASQITSLTIVNSTVYSGADQSKHQSSASLAFVWGIHRGPVNSPHKWPVTRKMFPFDDVIMIIWHIIWPQTAVKSMGA